MSSDVRQAPEYGRYMERIGWSVVRLSVNSEQLAVFVRKIGPVSIVKIQRPKVLPEWKSLDKILRKNRVFMCKIEPNLSLSRELISVGFKLDNWPLLATKTLHVDLRPSEKEIFGSFNKDARYCLRKLFVVGGRLLVEIDDFQKFYKIWKAANKIKGLWTPSKKDFLSLVDSFENKCFCITLNDLGGCLVLLHKETAYYFYSGTLPEGKKYELPYAVVWEAMKIAKKRGMKKWDFEGIFDSRWPNKDWKGFTHFKKSFGGAEIEFPGCFTKWRWPF